MITDYWQVVSASIGTIAVAIFLGMGALMFVSRTLRRQLMRLTNYDRALRADIETRVLRAAVRRHGFKLDGNTYVIALSGKDIPHDWSIQPGDPEAI